MIIERDSFKNGSICNEASVELKKIEDFDIEKLEIDLSIPKEKLYYHKNWVVDNKGEYYYFKTLQNYNDFIGEELAKKLNIKSAHYELAKLNNEFVVASKNFNINKVKYFTAFDIINDDILYKSNLEKLKYIENIYGKAVVLDILKMSSLDILMRQIDRVPSNYAFEQKQNKLKLAPLHDYSFAFGSIECYKYFNYILNLDFNSGSINNDIEIIMNKYPEFYHYIKIMNNTNLIDITNTIIEKNNFNYNEKLENKYKLEDEISHKLLKKIL